VSAIALVIAGAPSAQAATPLRIMPLGDSITGSPGCWRALLWQHLSGVSQYQVRARDAAGNTSAFTAPVNALPPPCPPPTDTQAPTTPGTPAASGVTASQASLSWTASTDNVGVTGYDVFRAPGASGGTFAIVGSAATTSFTNTGLAASTTYRYQVRARDAAGNYRPSRPPSRSPHRAAAAPETAARSTARSATRGRADSRAGSW
jgi:chitodextrinase